MEVYSYEFDRSLFFPASLAKEMKYFFKNMLLHEFGKLFLKKAHNCVEGGLEAEAIERYAAGGAEQRVQPNVQPGGEKQEAAGFQQRADGEEHVEQRRQHAARHRKAAYAPQQTSASLPHIVPNLLDALINVHVEVRGAALDALGGYDTAELGKQLQ